MTRFTDLADIINAGTASDRLGAALMQTWEWEGHSRQEAVIETANERRLRRQILVEQGFRLKYDGE